MHFGNKRVKRCFLLALLFLVGACLSKKGPAGPGSADWGVDITWYGQSCFSIRDSLNRVVAIDPFDDTVGYDNLRLRADAVLVTHDHFDHNYVQAVRAKRRNLELVKSTGSIRVAGDMLVDGFLSYHDQEAGQIHGRNIIYRFKMGSLRIVHMGDFGQKKLTPFQISLIGPVDVLLLPVGGVTTVGPEEAKQIVDDLKPSVVIPMHYGNIRFYKLQEVDAFTRLFPNEEVTWSEGSTVRIKVKNFKVNPEIIVLKPHGGVKGS